MNEGPKKNAHVFFCALYPVVVTVALVLLKMGPGLPHYISWFDTVLLLLATQRLVRLFNYDEITDWFRDLVSGPEPRNAVRETLVTLLTCPWCIAPWLALPLAFAYFYTPLAWFPIFVLAVAGAASLLQISANLIGWSAERAKIETHMLDGELVE